MVDASGGPDHRSWAEIEADAEAGREREDVALPPLLPQTDDPMLAFAQVAALRLAADSVGMKHDPNWDATEAAVGDQVRWANGAPDGGTRIGPPGTEAAEPVAPLELPED